MAEIPTKNWFSRRMLTIRSDFILNANQYHSTRALVIFKIAEKSRLLQRQHRNGGDDADKMVHNLIVLTENRLVVATNRKPSVDCRLLAMKWCAQSQQNTQDPNFHYLRGGFSAKLLEFIYLALIKYNCWLWGVRMIENERERPIDKGLTRIYKKNNSDVSLERSVQRCMLVSPFGNSAPFLLSRCVYLISHENGISFIAFSAKESIYVASGYWIRNAHRAVVKWYRTRTHVGCM